MAKSFLETMMGLGTQDLMVLGKDSIYYNSHLNEIKPFFVFNDELKYNSPEDNNYYEICSKYLTTESMKSTELLDSDSEFKINVYDYLGSFEHNLPNKSSDSILLFVSICQSITNFDIHFDNEYLLAKAIQKNVIELVKYLLDLGCDFGECYKYHHQIMFP